MSAAIFTKWDKLIAGYSVDVSPQDLDKITLRDFMDVASDTGLKVEVQRIRQGFFRLLVSA